MTLLEEIQNSAVDANSDLGTILRKCKLLAARLGSRPLEDWLIWESNGYPDGIEVPDYRIWPLEVKGHFSGPFGSGLRNAPIPWACLPKGARMQYQRYQCRQSIASIEAVLEKGESGSLSVSTGDLALSLGAKVYQGQNCVQAWAEFSISNLVELLNSVRNRLLDFALAVWKEEPMAGEVGDNSTKSLESSKVTQIFNTTVYGGSANLVGTVSESSIVFNIGTQDFPSLENLLRENGLGDEDISELQVAVQADENVARGKGFGPKVSNWISKMVKKAADGSWSIGVGAAGNLLAQALTKFYGL